MANLSITRRCRRDCAFCFAAEEREREPLDMTPDAFDGALDFLERSDVPVARLLGGEPTLHPAFASLAERALDRGFRLTVMTGGLVPPGALSYLESLPPDLVTVYLNAATPGVDDEVLVAAQERLCDALGGRVEAGVTLVQARSDPGFLLEWIERFGMRRSVRIGVAHPIAGGGNASVSTRGLRAVGAAIEEFVARAEGVGVSVGFDCGITPCMFSPDFAEKHAEVVADVGTRCAPIVDVLPECEVVACYALASLARLPLDGATRTGLIAALEAALPPAAPGVFGECGECSFRAAGRCRGGCRARRTALAPAGAAAEAMA